MLFNSYIFIFAFLPVTLFGFYLLGGRGRHNAALSWLVLASFFFYGWWKPVYLLFIIASIVFNYLWGIALEKALALRRKQLFIFGIVVNLGFLGYFKYANFFVANLNLLLDSSFHLETVFLPLAISFFTFTQIVYLVDAYEGKAREHDFQQYCLFVVFFPHLIAGPIVHHKELMPQFVKNIAYKLDYEHLAVGITVFVLGLFKKVVLADNIAVYATPVFNAAEQGVALTFFEAWCGALAYTFQLYFDFSGYSDMAIGLARMFGIYLPLNFNSPYKARNIIEFWQRWHITLSRFLRDYVYIPLGGNRKGEARRYVNLMLTMLLGGFWHGAGWAFIAWGALHGAYLIVNHAWHGLQRKLNYDLNSHTVIGDMCARSLTFLAVVVGWVYFRAASFDGANNILSAMFGMRGISLPPSLQAQLGDYQTLAMASGVQFNGAFIHNLADWPRGIGLLLTLYIIARYAPNTQQIMRRFQAVPEFYGDVQMWLNGIAEWRPSRIVAIVLAVMSLIAFKYMAAPSEFLYFQF